MVTLADLETRLVDQVGLEPPEVHPPLPHKGTTMLGPNNPVCVCFRTTSFKVVEDGYRPTVKSRLALGFQFFNLHF